MAHNNLKTSVVCLCEAVANNEMLLDYESLRYIQASKAAAAITTVWNPLCGWFGSACMRKTRQAGILLFEAMSVQYNKPRLSHRILASYDLHRIYHDDVVLTLFFAIYCRRYDWFSIHDTAV